MPCNRARHHLTAAVVGLLALLAASARGDEPKPAEWTVLLYMDADGDLEARMLENLREMASVASPQGVHVVALLDRHPAGEPEGQFSNAPVGGLADGSAASLLRVEKGKLVLLEGRPEPNMGEPDTLSDFVVEARRRFPAKRTALILAGHGWSWRGVCSDDTSDDDSLTLDELRGAFERIVKAGGPIDLLGFDAGLMANLEVAAGLSSFASVLVASEEVQPAHGWSYGPVLKALAAKADLSPTELGLAIAESCRSGATATLSVLDLAHVDAVAEAVAALGTAAVVTMKGQGREGWLALARARERATRYGRQGAPGAEGAAVFDAGDLASEMGAVVAGGATEAVKTALAEAVVRSVNGSARAKSTGLSVFLPRTPKALEGYSALRMSWNWGGWAAFAKEFASRAAKDSAKPESGAVEASGAEIEEGVKVTVKAAVPAFDDVAHVRFALGRKAGDSIVVQGLLPAAPGANGALAREWDGRAVVLEAGDRRLLCPVTSTDGEEEGGTFLAEAPCQLRRKGQSQWADVTLSLLLTEVDGAYSGDVLGAYEFGPGGPREVPFGKGDRLRAVHVAVAGDGSQRLAPDDDPSADLAVAATSDLKVGFARVPAGSWQVGFLLVDYSGNTTAAFVPVTVK